MSKDTLIALGEKNGHHLEIKCPTLGRVCLAVGNGQIVIGGQIIGELFRLNHRYLLRLPDDCQGKISNIKNDQRIINLSYGETLFTIDEEVAKPVVTIDEGTKPIIASERHIESPMDGMFYTSASPEGPPFVKIKDQISPGQTIGLIEVMKSFYPLKYQGHAKVTVTKINIKNATPVSSGTKLYSFVE